jgi:asparagine synthase (glutamine-hydrolysing)
MCGINGFTFPDRKLIKKMNQTILHRGPDDGGEYIDNYVSLGSRRLSIIDLSKNGHMPMSTEDGRFQIVFNGEIYNFQELRIDLISRGVKFKSKTDTEVILKGYREYGKEFISKLNGMFAFAIWDRSTRELILARDRIGIKPLYYALINNQLIFSSEIKAILNHKFPLKIDSNALNLYFRLLYIPSPYTIFQSVHKLAPGHLLTWKDEQIRIDRYWQPVHSPIKASREELLDLLDLQLNQSIKSNLISDRSIGIFLSGGIDSSLVLAIANNYINAPLHSYSAGFRVSDEQEKYNQDLKRAKIVSDYFETKHHEVMVTAEDVANYFPKTVYHLDEPLSNPNQVALYMLSKTAQTDSTVILGGDGGDELFAGYTRYLVLYYLSLYGALPPILKSQLPKLLSLHSKRLGSLLTKIKNHDRVKLHAMFLSQSESVISEILKPEINDFNITPAYFNSFMTSHSGLHIEEFLMTDMQTWLPEESLIKSDKLTMANSIEQRVPLLNNEIVDLALSIPFSKKIYPRQTKVLLRQVASRYLPDSITNATKWGFFSPVAKWLRNELKDFAYDWLTVSTAKDYINTKNAVKIFENHVNGGYQPHELWSLITFNCWYNTFMKSSR